MYPVIFVRIVINFIHQYFLLEYGKYRRNNRYASPDIKDITLGQEMMPTKENR